MSKAYNMSSKVPENVTITQAMQSTDTEIENSSVDIAKDKRKFLKCLLTTAAVCTVLNPFIGIFVLYHFSHSRAMMSHKLQNRQAEKAYRKLSYFLGAFGVLFSAVLFWGMIAFIIIRINSSQDPLPVPSQRPKPKGIEFDPDAKKLSNQMSKSRFLNSPSDEDNFRTVDTNANKNLRGSTSFPKFAISDLMKSKNALKSIVKVNETDTDTLNIQGKTNYTI